MYHRCNAVRQKGLVVTTGRAFYATGMNHAKWAMTSAGLACVLFVGVAIHEWRYKSAHPYAYGPAVVLVVAAAAGAVLAAVIFWVVRELEKDRERQREKARAASTRNSAQLNAGEITHEEYSGRFWEIGSDGDIETRLRVRMLEKAVLLLDPATRDVLAELTEPMRTELASEPGSWTINAVEALVRRHETVVYGEKSAD